MTSHRLLIEGGILVALAVGGSACAEVPLECCELTTLADKCGAPGRDVTANLRASIDDWREVGESEDEDACKALIASEDLGCFSSSFSYDEADAIVACKDE